MIVRFPNRFCVAVRRLPHFHLTSIGRGEDQERERERERERVDERVEHDAKTYAEHFPFKFLLPSSFQLNYRSCVTVEKQINKKNCPVHKESTLFMMYGFLF